MAKTTPPDEFPAQEPSFWDDPDLALGNFAKFEHKGDKVRGQITHIGKQSFTTKDKEGEHTKIVPQLTIMEEGAEEVIVTAGQIRLRIALLEVRPMVGQGIDITMTNEPRPGEAKEFEVFTF
jgi:hypothetical protein